MYRTPPFELPMIYYETASHYNRSFPRHEYIRSWNAPTLTRSTRHWYAQPSQSGIYDVRNLTYKPIPANSYKFTQLTVARTIGTMTSLNCQIAPIHIQHCSSFISDDFIKDDPDNDIDSDILLGDYRYVQVMDIQARL